MTDHPSSMPEEVPQESPALGMLPTRVELPTEILADRSKSAGRNLDELSFELFKETAGVLIACAHILVSYEDLEKFVFRRNQAICIGLLIRIVKFMKAILAILSHGDELGEVILGLLRCIGESAVNARFLMLKNDPSLFDQFVKVSLGPERELYDTISKNVAARGGQPLPVELRMLASIERLCTVSGLRIEEVPPKHAEWGGTMRKRLEALGLQDSYSMVQRVPSHAIHGTWADLAMHHLREQDGGFTPKLEELSVDSRILAPICMFVLAAAEGYYDAYLAANPQTNPLIERINDLTDRLQKLNSAHEEWYQENKRVVTNEVPPASAI